MAQAVQPPIFELGTFRIFLAGGSAPPSSTSDGAYLMGDWIINGSPTASGTAAWVCVSAPVAGSSIWKTIATGA